MSFPIPPFYHHFGAPLHEGSVIESRAFYALSASRSPSPLESIFNSELSGLAPGAAPLQPLIPPLRRCFPNINYEELPQKALSNQNNGTGKLDSATDVLSASHDSVERFFVRSTEKSVDRSSVGADESELSSASDEEATTSTSTINSQSSHTTLILKPDGEAGRPGSGGYNLDRELIKYGISKIFLRDIKNAVNKLMEQHLKQETPFSKQPAHLLQLVADKVADETASLATEHDRSLKTFDKLWPVYDMMKARLKYLATAQKKEKKELRLAAGGTKLARGQQSSMRKLKGRSRK